jgi:hypothetical protein
LIANFRREELFRRKTNYYSGVAFGAQRHPDAGSGCKEQAANQGDSDFQRDIDVLGIEGVGTNGQA